jgi:hypothetical protein
MSKIETFEYNYFESQDHLKKDSIVVMQRIGDLEIRHYGICDSQSPSDVRQTKGIIYRVSSDSETVLCKNIGFTPELCADTDLEQSKEFLENPNTVVFKSFESSLLRIWYDSVSERWYMSTNRKIDAFNSKWAKPESYGQIFTKLLQEHNPELTLEQYYSGLNKNLVYLFAVLSTQENRIITTKANDECQFIGAFDVTNNFTFSFEHPNVVFKNPDTVKGIDTIEKLSTRVNALDPSKQQGLMLIIPGENVQCIKIVHPSYYRAFKIRNNTLSPLNRFIQLMIEKYRNNLNTADMLIRELGDVYPECRQQFDEFKDVMYSIALNVLGAFKKRSQGKQNIFIPKQQNQVLKELFSESSKPENSVGFNPDNKLMFRIIYRLSENNLYYLFTSFKERKAKLGNGNLLTRDEINDLKSKITRRT